MRWACRGTWRSVLLGAVVCTLLAASSCRPELRIRMSTRVFHDGSLERRLEVLGREAGGDLPSEEDWLENSVGLRLAEPEAWDRVERGPDRLLAEGFFLDAGELPPMLVYSTDEGARTDRARTRLRIEERTVLRRWVYLEFHGDPFGREETERALDGMVELLAEALEAELARQFGEGLDTAPARRMLQTEGRSLALAMITIGRSVPGPGGDPRRAELWGRTLAQHGIPTVPVADPEEFWDQHIPLLVDWARRRTAESVSTPDQPLSPDDLLPFWPEPADPYPRLEEWTQRTWEDTEEIEERLLSQSNAIAGYYGRGTAPRFRFEIQVALPGTLYTTNGTPDGPRVHWMVRNDDMTLAESVLRAESLEPIDEALVALGARRRLAAADLVHLADLLWKRDDSGALRALLDEAVMEGDLRVLRNSGDEQIEALARELAELLDPQRDD
jgi:hypothetical protein